MTREQAMEWILPALHRTGGPSHLLQSAASPLSPNGSAGTPAAGAIPRMVAPAEWHAPPARGPVALSDEQQYVIDLVAQGYNVFFTGSAGASHFIWISSLSLSRT